MYKNIIDYLIIKHSGLFDSNYYLKEYKDVRLADLDPLWHFVSFGWKEARKPSKSFETLDYLESNPDVWRENINPLVHYMRFMEWEDRGLSNQLNADLKNGKSTNQYKLGTVKVIGSQRSFDEKGKKKTHKKFYIAIYFLRVYGFKEFAIKVLSKFGAAQSWVGPYTKKIGLDSLFYTQKRYANQDNYFPKVSVVVPNYNHARFLEERLESIYNQTYKNIEIILLDDCSTDDSRTILECYAEKNPENTRCDFNSINTGSPFAQWKKGVSLATGDLIWIAESDDFCDKNLLEMLVPYFADESILLSYAHTFFVDYSGKSHQFAFENYVSQIDPQKWRASYIETAHNEVNNALGLLNTIPNVSGVVFRKINGNFPLFNDPEWQKMKVCGDWLFYLNIIRGGRIAFCHNTHNFYRIHQAGSSKKAQTQDIYYKEHEKIGCAVASLYNVSDDVLNRLHRRVMDYYFQNIMNGSKERFFTCFDINKVFDSKKNRKPNILIATYAFAFGGGEIFPIRLANAMTENGLSVTLFNGGYEPPQVGVRKMLSPHTPVINNDPTLDLKSVLREFGTEIVHTHHASMENLFASARTNGSTGIKHVATMHGMYEMMEYFITNTREIQNSVDHWFYTTDKNIIPFKKNGLYIEQKFTKISNGMRIPEFHKVDLAPLGITPESFTACLASRALPEKGWKEAIEAIGKVREDTKKDLHLILIGEGPTYDELRSQNLPGYIHLLGYKANLDDYLLASQLGLIPSYFKGESFPLVIIECFMAEIPVIATRIGEIERMITADDCKIGGALINLQKGKVDPGELAEAIEKMVLDQDYYRESIKTVQILKKRFDIDNVAKQYIAEYQRLLR